MLGYRVADCNTARFFRSALHNEHKTTQGKGTYYIMAVTIVSILQVLVGAVLIVFVLGQSGKHSGLGAIAGASESFLSKNKAKSADAKLAKWTKWVALVFIVLTLVLNLI